MFPAMHIRLVETQTEKEELDILLWENLWKTLGFPADIRKSFALETPEIEFLALEDDTIIGGMVVNELSDTEYEIRHIAVNPDFRNRNVGKFLVERNEGNNHERTDNQNTERPG